ncbi:MAG TPA: MFS transporter [Noviherbaspirillum sp.]|uniref:MFS transporter n=1 Tax=Noviherbaspirillum sp. TaxID=1926288 RepID=UPI002B48A672|nr:MFS transporter [Noviherbaspirillum sp.]HJV84552.1 MFS transporter [Noviherbaspirillum sp.]
MTYTAAQRLDRLPEAAFHRRLAGMIGAGLLCDTFDLYLASSVMVALTTSGWATVAQNAQFASAGALGSLIGAFLAGWLGDRFGRRFSFQFNLILFGVMSFAAALAPDMSWLIAFRFIMGIGLGAEIVVGYSTITEFVPPHSRGKWSAILFLVGTSGLLISTLVGYLVIPNFGWRWMFVIAGGGALFVWFLRKNMPESPRWLESAGRHEEANRILDEIEAEISLKHVLPVPAAAAPARSSNYRAVDLFRPPLLRSTLLGMTLNIVALFALYGFVIWLPTFLVKQGLSMSHSLGYTTIMSSGSLIGVWLASRFSDRLGRKRGIVLLSIIAGAIGGIYPHAGSIEGTTVLGLLLITAIYCCSTLGYSTYVPELFPTQVRLRGSGISSVAGRAASIVAPQVVGVLYAYDGSVNGVTLALVGLLLLQAAAVGLFGIDMTQRSLDSQFDGSLQSTDGSAVGGLPVRSE